jgi:ADP-ribose pyrophosphatase YjhB (NUDIX family)
LYPELYIEYKGGEMYVQEEQVAACEIKYGQPQILRLNYPTPEDHFAFIRSTQKNGRSHDITLYVYHDNRLAVTRKPVYPLNSFRPPSGGMNPGENFEEGAGREGMEELGVEVILNRYLLRVLVDFVCSNKRINWITHVFQAYLKDPKRSNLAPTDQHEIVEAVWADQAEFFGPMRRGLLSVGSTGLLYRVHLHDYIWRRFGWGNVT